MIAIKIPNNNIAERKYILEVMFDEFLKLEYTIIIDDYSNDVIITLENGNWLKIEDHFFNNFPNELEYLKFDNIPSTILFAYNEFISESDIPIIYGNSIIESHPSNILCGIDIFASSFFMLTRWEEYVNKNRDNHDRFPSYESLAFKADFLDRPIVNEYVEMLWNMLMHLGIDHKRDKKEYQLYLTHDVDIPYSKCKNGLKEIAADILKRKAYKKGFLSIVRKIKVCLKLEKDPYNTFDYLMDISEKYGLKSYFFFMGKGLSKFDNMYKSNEIYIQRLIAKIKRRGHYIGIHPSYDAYNNSRQFQKEKKELEANINQHITFGREHYLRFEIPTTWQIWEDHDMEWDSSMSFADREGFRCGVCYEYSVFNILSRKKLKLKEKPLIVMEGSFITYQPEITPTNMEQKIIHLMNIVKKYNGNFIFLWHNSSFNTPKWEKYQDIYEKVL